MLRPYFGNKQVFPESLQVDYEKRAVKSVSDTVRQHATEMYVRPTQRRGGRTLSINVGEVHRAVSLRNRVPLVCQALESDKFLRANQLKLIAKTGPPSGQSTTVTYTYEFVDTKGSLSKEDPWARLRDI
jgi:hypothetical protein